MFAQLCKIQVTALGTQRVRRLAERDELTDGIAFTAPSLVRGLGLGNLASSMHSGIHVLSATKRTSCLCW